jgi:Flp pilus assembly protein TadD
MRMLRYIAPVQRFDPRLSRLARVRTRSTLSRCAAAPLPASNEWLGVGCACVAAALIAIVAGCESRDSLPDPASAEYRKVVTAFRVAVAALQVGDDATADSHLATMTKLAPGEPAGWADWGLLALRQRNFDVARERLDRAEGLAPQDAHVIQLSGILERNRGRPAAAIAELRKAVQIDPHDLRSRYALAQEIERQGGAGADDAFRRQVEAILAVDPRNLAALLELARVTAKLGDSTALAATLARIRVLSSTWPDDVQAQLVAAEQTATSQNAHAAATRLALLRNVLVRTPGYRDSFEKLKAAAGEEAQPFTHFVALPSPIVKPAPADTAISFDASAAGNGGNDWRWIGALQLASDGAPVVAVANGDAVRVANGATLAFPGGGAHRPPSPEGVLQVDFDYDFKTDLVLAGAGGVRFYRQAAANAFRDVTAATRLPAPIIDADYIGAWALDIEADGDLDIVLAPSEGAPIVLQNNGDGTFVATRPFDGITGLRQFVWADLDGDGNPDAAMLDADGHLHVFVNERQGRFHERPVPSDARAVKAIAAADVDHDGVLDLVSVGDDGAVLRMSATLAAPGWSTSELARVPASTATGDVRLHAADIDNNGAIDLVIARVSAAPDNGGAVVLLGDDSGRFTRLERAVGAARVFDVADVNGDGKLDLLGLAPDGTAAVSANRSARNYHWQVVRPHAAQAFGDQRINPFGIGGEIETRAGTLYEKQPIAGPQVHFGLGNETRVDVVRVLWPNGTVRAEFDVAPDQSIETEQRLKGSCPFLFAWNGTRMAFVKDAVPWGSAIGLRINTLGTAAVAATEEWYRIGRDALAPHDGYYDLRITGELWEVYYYDHLELMTVDHPAGTEVYVDERFVIPPAKLAITAVETPHPMVHATDDRGNDVTALVRAIDDQSLAGFEPGQYQGITRDHYVEIDLGDDVPASGPLYLIANGSVYPTDSSLNVALSQGERWRARGLVLEVPDGHGGWSVARDNLGFPAGRRKTILVDLTNVFRPGVAHRVRLRTNLEIYWDSIEWARGLPDTPLTITRLDPDVADLHYRGYSVIETQGTRAPELPEYARIAGTTQRWRDLEGYYTREGDVRELLKHTDDRYVIMNSGDEMSLRFPEQAPPRDGWIRDFVIAGDGWIKDGDYNSTFSRTVQPLPYHARSEYTDAPGRLEDEPAYRAHPGDWQTYHTRYVAADRFRQALRAAPAP